MERVRLKKRLPRKPFMYVTREECRERRRRRKMRRLGIKHDELIPADREFTAQLSALCRSVENHQASRRRMSSFLRRVSRFEEE